MVSVYRANFLSNLILNRTHKPVGMLLLLGTVPEEVGDSGERETGQLVRSAKFTCNAMNFACIRAEKGNF